MNSSRSKESRKRQRLEAQADLELKPRNQRARTQKAKEAVVNQDLPEALRHLQPIRVAGKKGGVEPKFRPGERLPIKQAILGVYDLHLSIAKLETVLPLVQDVELARTSLQELVDSQKRTRDAILNLQEEERDYGEEDDDDEDCREHRQADDAPVLSHKLSWFENGLIELVKYKIKHGNLDINVNDATRTSENARVGNVTRRLRYRHYRHFCKEGLAGQDLQALKGQHEALLTEHSYRIRVEWKENLELATAFGFPIRSERAGRPALPFEQFLEELRRFKSRRNHVRVPQLYETPQGVKLGLAVSNIRRSYQAYVGGKKSSLTKEKIEQLEAIGFQWKLRYGRPKKGDPKFRNKRLGIGYDDKCENAGAASNNSNGESNPPASEVG